MFLNYFLDKLYVVLNLIVNLVGVNEVFLDAAER
jgi:hypothetical protein